MMAGFMPCLTAPGYERAERAAADRTFPEGADANESFPSIGRKSSGAAANDIPNAVTPNVGSPCASRDRPSSKRLSYRDRKPPAR